MSNHSTALKIKNNRNWPVKFCVEHTALCRKFRSVHTIFKIPACACRLVFMIERVMSLCRTIPWMHSVAMLPVL